MTTTAEVIALLNKLDAELVQDTNDTKLVERGVEANQRRQNRIAVINKLKADIKQAVNQL